MKKISKAVSLLGLLFILISGTIDLDDLFNYENQNIPSYITKDNTPVSNQIVNQITTLGRVLFYDKNLSENNTIACASCHQQAFAFSDPLTSSVGLNGGNTGRHSMRLVNSRFSMG
jgi:cytochrome c peroxidase